MASKHSKKIGLAVWIVCFVSYLALGQLFMVCYFEDARYRYALGAWIAFGLSYAIWWFYEGIYLNARCRRVRDAYRQLAKDPSLVEAEVEDLFGDPMTYSRAEVLALVREEWFLVKAKELEISLEPLVSPAQLNGECN